MGEYENITLADVYRELVEVKRHVRHLEEFIVPEEEINKTELRDLDKLRADALREHREGKTTKVEDL